MGFAERYQATLSEIAEACALCRRDPASVSLLAVSKTVGPDTVAEAVAAGCGLFGENRPEQIAEKSELFPRVSWHFIGNIQSRQIERIVSAADLIHSVYQAHHLPKLDRAARKAGKVQDILLEVNVSGETSKSGLAPEEVPALAATCLEYPNLRLRGLMTMAPQGDPSLARECFAGLARLKAELAAALPPEAARGFTELSMGMSEDWREAIAEGSTIVRIGRALFSEGFCG